MNEEILPSESHVMSTRMALTVGFSFSRCSGVIGKQLLQRPVIEERLEDREIADVLVGEKLVQFVELLGLVA